MHTDTSNCHRNTSHGGVGAASPVRPALLRLTREDFEFKASMGFPERHCLQHKTARCVSLSDTRSAMDVVNTSKGKASGGGTAARLTVRVKGHGLCPGPSPRPV